MLQHKGHHVVIIALFVAYYRIRWTSFRFGSRPIFRHQGGDTGFMALEFRRLHLPANGGELNFERLDFGLEGKGLGVLRLAQAD